LKNISVIFAILSGVFLASCAPQTVAPSLTPIQKQQIQSRTYEGGQSKEDLFNAVLTVLQDKGYIIGNANLNTGIVTATSETRDNTTGWESAFGVTKKSQTSVTATVLKYGAGVRVRLNLLNTNEKTVQQCNAFGMCNTSDSSDDTIVYDGEIYTAIFNAIDDAMFVIGAGGI